MAVRIADQITILDVTDGFTVTLSSDGFTFAGDTNAIIQDANQSTSSVISVYLQSTAQTFTVNNSNITFVPTLTTAQKNLITATVSSGTLTVTVKPGFKTPCQVQIPIVIPTKEGDVTIIKAFAVSITPTGPKGDNITISSQTVKYCKSTSGTTVPADSSFTSDTPVATSTGEFLWTRTVVTYSDGTSTNAYSVSAHGAKGDKGDDITIKSQSVKYCKSSSGTTAPASSSFTSNTPVETSTGEFLWTRTIVTYSDNTSTTSYSVSAHGAKGDAGDDAITMAITTSDGDRFKNNTGSTTLTAHVYKAGAEVTGTALTALGAINWYVVSGGVATKIVSGSEPTGLTVSGADLTVTAAYVNGTANFEARLEA